MAVVEAKLGPVDVGDRGGGPVRGIGGGKGEGRACSEGHCQRCGGENPPQNPTGNCPVHIGIYERDLHADSRVSGEGGIRTRERACAPYSLSRRVPSATRPPLRALRRPGRDRRPTILEVPEWIGWP